MLQVKAVDPDDDMAAEIEYSIYENQSSGVKELFGINRHTGGIYLLKSAVPWGMYNFKTICSSKIKKNTYLTHICIHHCSRENPVKR